MRERAGVMAARADASGADPPGEAHRIVIVGGGAAGLELAVRLGGKLGRKREAEITLVDPNLAHLWKPLLHEVAAGRLDTSSHAIEFLPQASAHGFRFRLGWLEGLDRRRKTIALAPVVDEATGIELAPRQEVRYDTLVIAVGSVVSDFGLPGVRAHCAMLDGREQAEKFHKRFLAQHVHAQVTAEPPDEADLNIGIVGGGATGVELAAELHRVTRQLVAYGFDRLDPERDVKLTLVEAADRLLPGLPDRIAEATDKKLRELGVRIRTGEQVSEATAEGLHTKSGGFIPCRMKVWAAGIMGPDILSGLGGLETNERNQLVVRQTLQTTRCEAIYALGDCAECPWPGRDTPVPPRAQAAHQQARLLARSLAGLRSDAPPLDFVYKDRGSLISLSGYTAIAGASNTIFGDVSFEGLFARLAYRSLYRGHQRTIHGLPDAILMTLSDWFRWRAEPSPKLH